VGLCFGAFLGTRYAMAAAWPHPPSPTPIPTGC
jgi:hypothetical protein